MNPIRYRGYYYDNETGLYYLQSRYYDPAIGRFVSADKYVSTGKGFTGYNMYAYCNNNTPNFADTEGDFPWLVIGILAASAIIGGILGATSDKKLGQNVIDENTNVPQIPTKPSITTHHNIMTQKEPVELSPTTNPSESKKESEPLTVGDRVKNTIIGASLGLATGGAVVSVVGAGAVVAGMGTSYITLLGATGQQVFAIGALAYDSVAIIFAPFFGIEMDTIEIEP